MVWWLAAPLVIWAGKKVYDAVSEDDARPRDYEAEAKQSELRERRELALSKARQALRSYLQAHGVVYDGDVENRISASELGNESGRSRLMTLCQSRFARSNDQKAMCSELQAAEGEAARIRLVQLRLRQFIAEHQKGISASVEKVRS